ncbi:MAG: tyrosine--tRNA ligase, partial [Nitrososphaeria archaeon]
LMGLAEPPKAPRESKVEKVIAAKMSKSKPWTAIFIHDSEDEVRQKLLKAWCPIKQTELNPVLELVKYVIFRERKQFLVERPAKYGGPVNFFSYVELEREYASGRVHPMDLKLSVTREISKIIDPIRRHFETPSNRKLLEVFEQTKITR